MKTPFKLMIAAAALFASCKKENVNTQQAVNANNVSEAMISENGNNPDEAVLNDNKPAQTGYVYIESNDPNANSIITYEQGADGKLSWAFETTSGGKGSGAGLGSEGSIAINADHTWLVAVNAGSNSVSSFKIKNDGGLELKHTASSGGTLPISVCIYNNLVYVVNSTTANITGFTLGANGKLAKIDGAEKNLSDVTAGPAQISFNAWGNGLLVTEKNTNKISSFSIDASGAITGSNYTDAVGQTPFGFTWSRNKYVIVTNAFGGAANQSSCTSYQSMNLNVTDVNGSVANHQSAACWATATEFGRYVFVANTGSNNLNAYYVSQSGAIYYLPWTQIPAGSKPADITVSANNMYVYNINGGDHTITEYKRTALGRLQPIGTVTSIPQYAAGMVCF